MPPLVVVEAGGQREAFDEYLVCSFSPQEGICHFRRQYRRGDTRLRRLLQGQSQATLTLFCDPEGTAPALRISGEARLFVLSHPESRPWGVIEDLQVRGAIEEL